MKAKPPIITMAEVPEQTQTLVKQKEQLEMQLQQILHRVHQIENSLHENDSLKKRVQELLAESMAAFQIEWERKSSYFPEIELGMLQSAIEKVAPAAKK